MHSARKWDFRARPLQCHKMHALLNFSVKHVVRGVEPCGLPRTLRTHESGRPSALGHEFEAGPHVLRILRSAHVRIDLNKTNRSQSEKLQRAFLN